MKNKLFLPAAILLVIGISSPGATTGQDGRTSTKALRFNLEIFAGFNAILSSDLNLQARYYNAYQLFFYTGQYEYLQSQYGNTFTYSANRSGDDKLKTIKSGFPFGVRLKVALSRAFSLSLGLEYLEKNQLSSTSIRYHIDDRSQGLIQTTPRELEISYPDFFLGVSAWIPQIGIHLTKPLGKRWQVGGTFSAGPMLAHCRSVLESQYKYRYSNGYRSESYYLLDMKGAGTGVALDLSAELRLKLTGRLSFFLASGYAWRRAANIKGTGHNQSLFLDSNSTQNLIENSWEGRWRKKDVLYSIYGSQFAETYYGNNFNSGEDTDNFVLNLSAFQAKAGFSWAF